MKKTFALTAENKTPERHLEAIKHEIRKYIRRENKKRVPEGVDYWRFVCAFGKDKEQPKPIEFPAIMTHIDEAAGENCSSFYLEIISTEGIRESNKK